MKKLSKTEIKEKDDLATKIEAAATKVRAAVEAINEKLLDLIREAESAVEEYNATVDEWNEFRSGIEEQQQEFFDNRSESWQEGDAGSDYQGWIDEWVDEPEHIEIDFPDQIQEPDLDLADHINQLPDELIA